MSYKGPFKYHVGTFGERGRGLSQNANSGEGISGRMLTLALGGRGGRVGPMARTKV